MTYAGAAKLTTPRYFTPFAQWLFRARSEHSETRSHPSHAVHSYPQVILPLLIFSNIATVTITVSVTDVTIATGTVRGDLYVKNLLSFVRFF